MLTNVNTLLCEVVPYLEFNDKNNWYIPTGTASCGNVERTEKEE